MKVIWNANFALRPDRARRVARWLKEKAQQLKEESERPVVQVGTPPSEVESEAA